MSGQTANDLILRILDRVRVPALTSGEAGNFERANCRLTCSRGGGRLDAAVSRPCIF